MPLFVDDYEGATTHLTLEEDGAYMRLLRLCWRTPRCTIPDDADWIMRRLRIDRQTYDRLVAPLINEFFKRARGRIFQKRLLQEFVYAVERQKKRSEAGKRGGSAKAQKTNDKTSSKRTALLEQTQGIAVAPSPAQPRPIEEGEEAKASPPRRARRAAGVDAPIPDDWSPTLGPAAQAIVDGWPPGLLERDALAFRSHAEANGRLAKDWDAAFRTWITKTEQRRIDNGQTQQSAGHSGRDMGRTEAAARNLLAEFAEPGRS
jgi:uncharacterized protein YdaU (DUF1376 family)